MSFQIQLCFFILSDQTTSGTGQMFSIGLINTRQGYSFYLQYAMLVSLTHWGRVTHICVSKVIIIGSDNGLSPGRRQAIIWTNAGILLIGHLGINFSGFNRNQYIFIQENAF